LHADMIFNSGLQICGHVHMKYKWTCRITDQNRTEYVQIAEV